MNNGEQTQVPWELGIFMAVLHKSSTYRAILYFKGDKGNKD